MGQEDAIRAERESAQQAEDAQRQEDRLEQERAFPSREVVVTSTNIQARTLLNPRNFELRRVDGQSVLPDAVTSLADLEGKVLTMRYQRASRSSQTSS